MDKNLAKEKKALNDIEALKKDSIVTEDSLELQDMSRKERRNYQWKQEKEKLKELTFWRKVQYILNYYAWKFLAVVIAIGIILIIIQRIYIATRPVALDIVLVNDPGNVTFEESVTNIYTSYYEVPDDAVFIIDNNFEIYPDRTYTSQDIAYYNKMMAALTGDSTQIIICDAKVVDYYAVDGYVLELKHSLPEDIFTAIEAQERLYECDGPVEDYDFYAIDISDMEFTKRTNINLEQPYLFIPSTLGDKNREIAYNFIRILLEMENE